jgi:glyoxylate utilization-related uncharacterized protein
MERWGQQTLREYKRKPWVLRHYRNVDGISKPPKKVELKIEMELEHFDEKNQRWLQHAIAGFLGVSADAVWITEMEKGSVEVAIHGCHTTVTGLSHLCAPH